MNLKTITTVILLSCMLSGVALIAYGDFKQRTLEQQEQVETLEKSIPKYRSCNGNS